MIFLELMWEFLKVGFFSFGGGYATLPFLYHISANYGWFSSKQLSDMIAISSITPGPVGVNVATFAGFVTTGILGAFIATFSVILPSYIIVVIVSKLLKKFKENKHVQAGIYAIKPAGCGLLAAVAVKIFVDNVHGAGMYLIFAGLLLFSLKHKKDALIYLGISALVGLVFGILGII